MRAFALMGVLMIAAAAAAEAQTISAGAGYRTTSETFGESSVFTQYFEPARVDSLYRLRDAPLVDVGVGIPLRGGWSVVAGVSVDNQAGDATLTGRIPSPFFFRQFRSVELPLGDVDRREIAVRGELAWALRFGAWEMQLSGGPVAMNVRQQFATGVTVRELTFPFDAVTLDVGSLAAENEWALGGTAAADLSWYPTPRFGVGVTGRYTGAEVTLRDIPTTAGGPSVVVGVRFRP